jgi:hypothetical protein
MGELPINSTVLLKRSPHDPVERPVSRIYAASAKVRVLGGSEGAAVPTAINSSIATAKPAPFPHAVIKLR